MEKIARISIFFRIVFQIIFITLPMLILIGWVFAPSPVGIFDNAISFSVIPKIYANLANHSPIILHTLSSYEKAFGFLVDMIPTSIELLALYFLIKLFKRFEKGEIFTLTTVNYIRNIGYAILAEQLATPINEFLMGFVLTWHNPPGHRLASITYDQTNFGMLLMGLMVILISWIMAEGYKLREEQQLTV